jgi:hypothetical protein
VKTWIKPYATARDGRGAWLAFKAHYRGSSEIEAIETAAEERLDSLVYRGEKSNYNLETHVSMHRKSHQEIAKATGNEIPEVTKVRRLLKSLKTDTMETAVATVRGLDNLRGDFDATVNYLRTFIINTRSDSRNVSEFSAKGKSSNKKATNYKGKGKGKNQSGGKQSNRLDRYYKPQEWFKLEQSVRDEITELRKKRKVSKVSSQKESESEKDDSSVDSTPGGETSQRNSKKKKVSFAKKKK